MKRKYWEEILTAFSLANIFFFAGWRKLIYPNSPLYNVKFAPNYLDYLGLLLIVILVAVFFLGALWLSRYLAKGKTPIIAKWFFLVVLLVSLFEIAIIIIKAQYWIVPFIGRRNVLISAAILIFVSVIALLKFNKHIVSFARAVILILSPLVLITFSQAVWGIYTSIGSLQEPTSLQSFNFQTVPKPQIASRIVWIIFDELDYKAAFEKRPSEIEMPEFDKLKKESLMATQANPADYHGTLLAMTSLIEGKKVEKAEPKGKDELLLTYADSDKQQAKFGETKNVFSNVRNLGGNTAIVGWYHPYCRVLKRDLSACHWESYDPATDFHTQSLVQAMVSNIKILFELLPFEYRSLLIKDNAYIERHNNMLNATEKVVTNSDIDLALIHLPFPHYPNRYNRFKEDFSGGEGYLDSLVLTNKILGKIRQDMEKANLWNNSIIIVSSDHQWRVKERKAFLTPKDFEYTDTIEDHRIPFFVKLKNQDNSLIYDEPFNTVITHDLILALIKGEISTSQEVKEWLDSHGANE